MSDEQFTPAYLGLVAERPRTILPGSEYDKYFPKPNLKGTIIIDDGNVKQTVRLMQDFVVKFKDDTKKIADLLRGNTLEETCSNIWHFLYNHVQYKLDKDGVEQLRRPARAWHDRQQGIDCDCFSIFVGSILYNLGIPFRFRVTKYNAGWQHVYVVVPDGKGHITIDCVLDAYNDEKPFTDKFDTKMDAKSNLSGIPIEFLSGLNNVNPLFDLELDGVLSGCLSGDEPTEADRLAKLKQYLITTRDYIAANPHSVLLSGGAKNNLKMLNYAIEHWDTPQRDAALDALEKLENESEGSETVDGIGKISVKKFFGNVKEAVKNVGSNIKEDLKKVGNAVVKYNPISLALRGGFLLGMKINIFHMAQKLYPGYLTEAEAKKAGVSSSDWQKAVKAVKEIEHRFVDKLKGDKKHLKDAIMEGRASKKFDELNGADVLNGLGSAALIATLTTAAVPLAAAAKSMDDAGITADDKKKFGEKMGAFFKKAGAGVKKIFDKKKGEKSAADAPAEDAPAADDGSGSGTDDSETKPPTFLQKIGTFVKENPVKVGVGVLLVGTGITLAVSPKARAFVGIGKKKGGVSGLGRVKVYKSGKHLVKKKGKMLRKGSHVKAITLASAK